ncbi:MAG: precorrin-4 C(11)-methyltransferase [Dissulfuribacterales bacterium]
MTKSFGIPTQMTQDPNYSRRFPIVFVGAGPGDPELITVKGQRALETADSVFYAGSLVSQAVLQWTKPGTEAIDTAPMTLDTIVTGMIERHEAGKRVVRLHSGDPSIYGAINEQIAILNEHNVPYRIIPGVTSALAAAAAMGCELTVPEHTQTVIITRMEGRTPVPKREVLQSLAKHKSSMAIYLSVHRIEDVCAELAAVYGWDMEAVVAYKVSLPEEHILRGTLKTLPRLVQEANIDRQALILIGPFLNADVNTRSKLYDSNFSHGFRQ